MTPKTIAVALAILTLALPTVSAYQAPKLRDVHISVEVTVPGIEVPPLPARPEGPNLDLGAVVDFAVGARDYCDNGSGFGGESGNCPISCEPGSVMSATMSTKNGDPNLWVQAAIDCGGVGTSRTCPGEASCTTPEAYSAAWAKGMCHGAVANENGDWYKWALSCSVGGGQDLGLLSNYEHDDQATASGDLCSAIMATGAHERAGDYRLVSGEGQTAAAAAFGNGFCVEYAAVLEVVGTELNVLA